MIGITLIGFAAAICTTLALLPQVIKAVRTKHTADLSFAMYLLLAAGILLWVIYGFLIHDMPVFIANSISLILSLIVLFCIIKYK